MQLRYEKFGIGRTGDESLAGLYEVSEMGMHSNLEMRDYAFVPAEMSEDIVMNCRIIGNKERESKQLHRP